MTKDKYIAFQNRIGSAYVLGMPAAILLVYALSMVNITVGGIQVTPLSACGLGLSVIFAIVVLINFLFFEEIPASRRRLAFNTAIPSLEQDIPSSRDTISSSEPRRS